MVWLLQNLIRPFSLSSRSKQLERNRPLLQKDVLQEQGDQFSLTPETLPSYADEMRSAFKKVQSFGSHITHDKSFNQIVSFRRQGGFQNKQNVALINIDSHSDLYHLKSARTLWSPGSWMNGAILKTPEITEVIWVRPLEIDAVTQLRHPAFDAVSQQKPGVTGCPIFHYGANKQAYIDAPSFNICYNEPDEELLKSDSCRLLTLSTIPLSQIPDMANRDVILSIDMDYFSNTGFDTIGDTKVPYKGGGYVASVFKTLNNAHVKPFLLTLALSPKYSFTPYKWPIFWRQYSDPLFQAVKHNKTTIESL